MKLVLRSFYGTAFWMLRPQSPIHWKLSTGGKIILEPGHSFTQCLWPGIDNYEPDVRAFLEAALKEGDVFVDCGANIGYFSILAGDIVGVSGRVVSIEANPITCEILRRNLLQNCLSEPVHAALTSNAGELTLYAPRQRGDIYSSLRLGGIFNESEPLDTFRVPGVTLDSVLERLNVDKVNLIKIDVEGGEMDVLRSAFRVLNQMRPLCIIEYGVHTWTSFGSTVQDLKSLAEQMDYNIYRIEADPLVLRSPNSEDWSVDYSNILLVPAERTFPWKRED